MARASRFHRHKAVALCASIHQLEKFRCLLDLADSNRPRYHSNLAECPMSHDRLSGLRLTKTERLVVVALSYLFTAPVVWGYGRKLISYLVATFHETQRQLRAEDRDRRRRDAD